MKRNDYIASTKEMDSRKDKAMEFYNAILDPYEHPWLVTDQASIYDITLDEDNEIIDRIDKYYSVKIDKKMLGIAFWKLLDYLDKMRIKN